MYSIKNSYIMKRATAYAVALSISLRGFMRGVSNILRNYLVK